MQFKLTQINHEKPPYIQQQPHKKHPFPLIEKENLTDTISLSGPSLNDSK